MEYATLVSFYERIESTTKRLEMTDLLVQLFRHVPPEEIKEVVYLTEGGIAPDYAGIELGLADKLAIRVLAQVTGLESTVVQTIAKERGDLGLVAEMAIAERRQAAIAPGEPLTIRKVFDNLLAIAQASGEGSQQAKIDRLAELLGEAAPNEAKYIVRTVVGKMRLGIADRTILDALAATFATKEQKEGVERAYNTCSDLGEVAHVLATRGIDGLAAVRLQVGRPILSMLCERIPTLKETFERLGRCAFEYKYDGLRMQVHVSNGAVQIFSRRLENITAQFPEIVAAIPPAFTAGDGIIEGEGVPVDPNTGDFLPFQEVSRRRGRKFDLEKMAADFPVTLFLFDCLLRNGEDLTTRPYEERRQLLHGIVRTNDRVKLGHQIVTDDEAAAERFFQEAIQQGCEGLVAKALDSAYEAGARGYKWVKLKRDYQAAMTDTVDLVVVGGLAGRGKRAGMWGALLCAAYAKDADQFQTVCKLGTGFTDEMLASFADRFGPHRLEHRHARADSAMEADAWFAPAVVMEVLGSEITLSPVHTAARGAVREGSGLAIRFPRFTGRWRDDKKPEDATTVEEILGMYRRQLKAVKE
ncbi:MAG TPA: ATP-dependent DNA ligase [Thermoplasmata archaeon]|nr:ATP-dependent DNA ligase [Thermoplasmata archaeon]